MYNPQNERMYFAKAVKKNEVMDELFKPAKQRAPGLMVHLTVASGSWGYNACDLRAPAYLNPSSRSRLFRSFNLLNFVFAAR